MKKIIKIISSLLLIILCSEFIVSLPELPPVTDILKQIDKAEEMGTDITARVAITQQKSDQGARIMESIFYRRDSDDSFLIIMVAPASEKGNGYLRVGDNMWMYRRNTRSFQHINRDESIGGSDVSAGDFETRKFSELYNPALNESGKEIIEEEMLGNIPVYRVEVTARVDDVKYPKRVIWVTRDKYLTMKIDSYSLSGTLMETLYCKQYKNIEGHYIPLWQLVIDRFEQGNKTLVELSGISLKKIPGNVFTKAYLENLSR